MSTYRCLVTGAAGFIGSLLSERLVEDGHEVLAIDSLTDYYSANQKRANLDRLLACKSFRFLEADLLSVDLKPLIWESQIVYHLAGQPGVRGSWGDGFRAYLDNNIAATQRLLEAAVGAPLRRFVYSSSSSVYGDGSSASSDETDVPTPASPYGVTKLAAEKLCSAYYSNHGVPTVSLRYFSVYGLT